MASANPIPLRSRVAKDDPVVQDILGAAMAEFAQLGLAGARVDAIVAQTKTSKRMIYYHFGSKEGLYEAVLEHAFRTIRRDDRDVELDVMEPLAALACYAGIAFDVHNDNPDFVRLVMQENLRGASSLRQSTVIPQINAIGLRTLKRLVERGQSAGLVRQDLNVLDLYTNLVALCFHHVSNRLSFAANFGQSPDSEEVRLARREAIIESVLRFV